MGESHGPDLPRDAPTAPSMTQQNLIDKRGIHVVIFAMKLSLSSVRPIPGVSLTTEPRVFVLTPLDYTLTKNPPAWPNSRRVTPVESPRDFAKSFRAHSYGKCPFWPQFLVSKIFRINGQFAKSFKAYSYEKTPRKSFRIHSYRNKDLKSPGIILLQERVGGGIFPTQPAHAPRNTSRFSALQSVAWPCYSWGTCNERHTRHNASTEQAALGTSHEPCLKT
jgi:hypothetical protein